MKTFTMALDHTATLACDTCYILYKNLYLKYIKKKESLIWTDSLLAISSENDSIVWMKMAEFARAWAYATGLQIRVIPGTVLVPSNLRQIEMISNSYYEYKALQPQVLLKNGTEFIRVAKIDTPEQADLLKLYTTADANPDIYFKILFFLHTIVYPSTDDSSGVTYINDTISRIRDVDCRIEIINKGPFGKIEDGDVGVYIKNKVRHAIAHIKRTRGLNLVIDDKEQRDSLKAIVEILKEIAKYKLDNDFQLSEIATPNICRLYNPAEEFPKK